MTERVTLFIDVVLPLAVPQLYTYRIPQELNDIIKPGQRVIVQLGKSKLYTAMVRRIHEQAPKHYTAKYIDSLLDEQPIIQEEQFKLWEWISEYYCCTIGEVMLAAIPGSMRIGSETIFVLNEVDVQQDSLNEKELLIIDALSLRHTLTLPDVSELLGIKSVQQLMNGLIKKGVVTVQEELKFKYKPKFRSVLVLNEPYNSEEKLKDLFIHLEKDKRTVKQIDALLKFIQLGKVISQHPIPVVKSEIIKQLDGNGSAIESLIKKQILTVKQERVDRLALENEHLVNQFELSDFQKEAYNQIIAKFEEKKVVLLHGVTGSGKTEIYIKLIEKTLSEKSGQVLYLLPEIALTTQIINRLRKYFGDQVGIYHSKFNEHERAEIWNKTLKGDYRIVLGARSALFLPFRQISLVIVDEEHESSFKQFDPSPRYNARDSALVLASFFNAPALLGSATPAIESYYNAQENKFGLVVIKKRFGGVLLPEIQCVDIKTASKRKEMHHTFSHDLLENIKQCIQQNEQIILFQNRRGYAPQWTCETCSWVPRCKNCDVSLTYHKFTHQLTCHYCARTYPPPNVCSACGSNKLKMLGFGTEKIEEDLQALIPGIRIARMDLDSTRTKNAYLKLINDFEDRQLDVLVGTQMVSKGLDFDHVTLVGVLNADVMLNFPDYRAFERSYQLLSQVAGRSGRKNKRGKVLIQTYNPNHWIIQKVMNTDYEGMYQQELIERKNFHYPPFVKMIRLTLRHKDRLVVKESSLFLSKQLKNSFQKRVLGPEEPSIARIRNYYYQQIILKFERNSNYKEMKIKMQEIIGTFKQQNEYKRVLVDIDVDPI